MKGVYRITYSANGKRHEEEVRASSAGDAFDKLVHGMPEERLLDVVRQSRTFQGARFNVIEPDGTRGASTVRDLPYKPREPS